MQDINLNIETINYTKWIVSEQKYVMHRFNMTKIVPRMKQTRIKIQLEFHRVIAKRLHCRPSTFHFATLTGFSALPARLLLSVLTRPAPAWHDDLYQCCGNHDNLTISRAVPAPVQSPARGRLGCGGVIRFSQLSTAGGRSAVSSSR